MTSKIFDLNAKHEIVFSQDGKTAGKIDCCYLVAKSSLTLATLWTAAHQDPLSLGFPKQEYWGGFPFPPPGDLPNPGIESASPVSPALQVNSLPTETLGMLKSHQRRFNLISIFCIFQL